MFLYGLHLSCSQCCWGKLQKCAAHVGPARRVKSSSRCWCRCCGYGRTSQSTWRTVTDSTWAWWQTHWRSAFHLVPWSAGSYSWPAWSLDERERAREDLSYITKGDIKSALLTALLQREQASSLSLPLQNTRHRQDNDISYFINSLFVTFQPLRGNVLIVCNMGIHMTPVLCAWECVCLEIYDTSFIFTSHILFIKSFNYRIYLSKPLCFCSFSAFIWPSLV